MSQSGQSQTVTVTLPAGSHWLCSCGQAQNYPYCDGSHKGTGLSPVELKLESTKQVEISR